MLSVFLMPICILASHSIDKRVQEYMASFLMVEVLIARRLHGAGHLLFYIFFEAGLIPMYLIIGSGAAPTASTRPTNSSSTPCSDRC
jgi:NADH-quinone oxidoreductase subunit M